MPAEGQSPYLRDPSSPRGSPGSCQKSHAQASPRRSEPDAGAGAGPGGSVSWADQAVWLVTEVASHL